MNPHDDSKDKKNPLFNNELDSIHPDIQDDDAEDEQDDLDEDEQDSLNEDDEQYDLDDEDQEEDQDDEDEDDDKVAHAPAKPQGRGLRSLPVVEEEEELPPSKTKIKKQMHDLRDLGEELTELGKDQIAQLDIPEILRDAIREMQRTKTFGAKRRQLQYIGKLMRDVDIAPIIAKLNTWKGTSQQHIGYMHQLERWRERLLETDTALTELLTAYPETDVQRLRTLIRNTLKEREAGKPAKNYREIFQVLRETIAEPT
ncbi:MAG: ribosome biogenesis factor YjgA [Gallionella sp.]|nr:ribosome biogenesis factor YjgA [Gallionella sp.]